MPTNDAAFAADLAADAAACADIVAASISQQEAIAALHAHVANDPTLRAHLECIIEGRAKNLNKPGPRGATPLLVACLQGNAAVAAALLQAGADPTLEGDTTEEQHTPEQLAARYQKHEICAWLAVTQDWSQLRIVAGCRFHKIGSILLRQGRITDASWAAPEMLAALATSKAGSGLTLLPWKDAAPVCSTTSKLVADATRGWHRKTHWLHHSNATSKTGAYRLHCWKQRSVATASTRDLVASTATRAREACPAVVLWLLFLSWTTDLVGTLTPTIRVIQPIRQSAASEHTK
eukprot:gene10823-29435_t